ncbi:MAG: uroporphyrinogen decarboxylase [Thermogutta sp.]|nr:MAG: uroporphyrinogen decarboxylase [Thermogutta sp.]
MRDDQWQQLQRLIAGDSSEPAVGFIIDSPWLPGWCGVTIREYLCSEKNWLAANLRAVQTFPDVWFIPGFWAEFGMCTEPSAFGGRCRFPTNEFPHIEPVLRSWSDVDTLTLPDCERDGLLPFVLERLHQTEPLIREAGHRIRFAVSRGPLNIASYLLGQTEFLLGLKTEVDRAHRLIGLITAFIKNWLTCQKTHFPDIDGILILDDLIGFIGKKDFEEFVVPYLQDIFATLDVSVKMLHNDAHGLITARYLQAMGVNVFNFSHEHDMEDVRDLAGPDVVLMGNISPRDILAAGTPEDCRREVRRIWESLTDRCRILWSAGGGMPPGVSSENIEAVVSEVRKLSAQVEEPNAPRGSLRTEAN